MLLLFSWTLKFLVQYIGNIGKREVIDVMNRFGHCVSYNFVEDFETELALVLLRNLSYCLKLCFADPISTLELPLIISIFSLKHLREKIR
jgi:hypothetical protein